MTRCRVQFIIIFSLLLPLGSFGQSVEQLIDFADLKYSQGQFQLAAMEYQRALFFGSKNNIGALYQSTGDCYFQMGEYDKAGKNYQFAVSAVNTIEQKAENRLRKVSCLLLESKYNLALLELYNLPRELPDSLYKKQQVLFGIAYFGLNEFEKSEQHFLNLYEETENIDKNQLVKYFDSNKLSRPSPRVAFWMSVIIPGSGQLYAGDIKNGLNSFVLSIGLAVLTYNIAVSRSILDALMTAFPWWQRYHIGGYNAAQRIAEKKRQENRAEIYDLIYEMVMREL